MRRSRGLAALALAFITSLTTLPAAPGQQVAGTTPIALHPDNPHYFPWRGRPTILITSAEHYGAVMNLDFDYRKYLDTLAADGMNYTRVFSGAYVEPQGAFKIARNTLAPRPGRFLAPWAAQQPARRTRRRQQVRSLALGRRLLRRLKDFVAHAAARNVVVELTLFCPIYEEVQWSLSPMNAANNVNGVGKVGRNDVYTLDKDRALLAVQEALIRKLVTELNAFDNLYFEIGNEPYFGGVTMAWQHRIADVIVETERALPAKHLISQNIANRSAKIADPHPAVSIFNFHYASPPETVAMNYALNKVIGDNETGFRGMSDDDYRMEGWEFLLAGGGLYNNLDYSFAAGHEDGTFKYPPTQPGGGSRALAPATEDPERVHQRLRFHPDEAGQHGHQGWRAARRQRPRAGRARQGNGDLRPETAAHHREGHCREACPPTGTPSALQIELAAGEWRAEWVDTMTGSVVRTDSVRGGGVRAITPPDYRADIAVRLRRQ